MFKDALGVLESSKEFREWRKKNKDAYLSHGFFVIENKEDDWKIGYYHKKDDRITSFAVGKKITIEPEEEVFKEENKKINALDLKSIKLDLGDAVAIANAMQKEEYATESPVKIIAIVQNLDIGQVWNITFITQSFNVLNFKIKSDNGRIVEKKLSSLFEFRETGTHGAS